MRYSLILGILLTCCLSACRSVEQVGASFRAGSGAVTRPVVSGTKKLASATVSGTRAAASATLAGAKSLVQGAARLVTFGSASRPPAPAPLASTKPIDRAESSLPAVHSFPTTGLLVTESELGPDATRLQSTAVNLGGGWVLKGDALAYRLAPGADDPTALRIKGNPATAILTTDGATTTATAAELHYHANNQVLTLKGTPTLSTNTSRVSATSPSTQIHLHLPTGAISIRGPARWGD